MNVFRDFFQSRHFLFHSAITQPKFLPILIKGSSPVHLNNAPPWGEVEDDYRNYLMGDCDYRQVTLQEAEECMRGIAPQLAGVPTTSSGLGSSRAGADK